MRVWGRNSSKNLKDTYTETRGNGRKGTLEVGRMKGNKRDASKARGTSTETASSNESAKGNLLEVVIAYWRTKINKTYQIKPINVKQFASIQVCELVFKKLDDHTNLINLSVSLLG